MSRLRRLATVVCVAALGATTQALAEKADHDKPTDIVYDHGTANDLSGEYTWTGNVILTKGTILLRCDKLVARKDPDGYLSGTATMDAPGRLVYFREKREGFADQYIEGEAERIEYDEKSDTVKLFVHAVVRRLEGATMQDEARGAIIEYHSGNEQYFVQGSPNEHRGYVTLAPSRAGAAPAMQPGTNAAAGSTGNTPGSIPGTAPGNGAAPAAPAAPAAAAATAKSGAVLKPSVDLGASPP